MHPAALCRPSDMAGQNESQMEKVYELMRLNLGSLE